MGSPPCRSRSVSACEAPHPTFPVSPPGEGALGVSRVLFLFLDGVGIGPAHPDANPFLGANLPTLRALLGGTIPTLEEPEVFSAPGLPATPGGPDGGVARGEADPAGLSRPEAIAFPLDPLLGIEGLPQSGTGQTALFTGLNAPRIYGRHFGPWVPVRLRPRLQEENLLTRAQALGISCAFANAYPRGFERTSWARRPAGPPLMARAAGLLVRHEEALARGEALASEIVNSSWRTHLGREEIPEVTPQEAGRALARIAGEARLTFFAHYATDHAGHQGAFEASARALERVDGLLEGLVPQLLPGTLLVVASDHGNIEEVGRSHTRNPSFTLLAGPGARQLRGGLHAITDVPGLILQYLSGRH